MADDRAEGAAQYLPMCYIKRMMTPTGSLDQLFERVSVDCPAKKDMHAFEEWPNRQEVIAFLLSKLDALLQDTGVNRLWGTGFEWGVRHTCVVLGELKAAEAVEPMLALLDIVKRDWEAALYDAVVIAFEGMGEAALEPVYQRYKRDKRSPKHRSTWVNILACLGVRDARIQHALLEHLTVDGDEAIMLMADYGDPGNIPILEAYVKSAARYLNEHRLDPFKKEVRFEDHMASAYIDGRESYIMLRDQTPLDHPEFDTRVEALDRKLLKYADFSVYDKRRARDKDLKKKRA